MTAYSIEAAIKIKLFNKIIVSTDDEQVAVVARKCGAQVTFVRPKELAGDHTAAVPVIKHAIKYLVGKGL